MTVLEAILLICGGMPVFDSVCNALGTAGTGGFAVTNAGLATYANPYAEWVIGIFMVLFGVNFNLYYLMLIKKFRLALASEELRTFLGIVAVRSILMGINIYPIYGNLWETVRMAFFHVSTIISTTDSQTPTSISGRISVRR
jgi:trk system potassium uptake protein TrkH